MSASKEALRRRTLASVPMSQTSVTASANCVQIDRNTHDMRASTMPVSTVRLLKLIVTSVKVVAYVPRRPCDQ